MDEQFAEANFLGLPDTSGPADVVIASIPYELTTSYGQGTAEGPAACIIASAQVELYDILLEEELPAGKVIRTAGPWDGEGATLQEQLDGIGQYASEHYQSGAFPIFLGGEHGILPGLLRGCPEKALAVHQVGIRAYCRQEANRIENDHRIHTWFARDIMSPCTGSKAWSGWLESIKNIDGPVHLTVDIDGLDGALVPATGTPVPGGLTFWHAVETIETVFENSQVISADVNEIVPQVETPLTQFTAAMIATKIAAAHIATLR